MTVDDSFYLANRYNLLRPVSPLFTPIGVVTEAICDVGKRDQNLQFKWGVLYTLFQGPPKT